jgi:hypothetical protein
MKATDTVLQISEITLKMAIMAMCDLLIMIYFEIRVNILKIDPSQYYILKLGSKLVLKNYLLSKSILNNETANIYFNFKAIVRTCMHCFLMHSFSIRCISLNF